MSLFSGLSPWAILGAAIASFAFGGIWYTVLGRRWSAALANPRPAGQSSPSVANLAVTVVAEFVMAYLFAGLLMHLAQAGIPSTARNGIISGLFLWLGFVAMPLIVNNLYQKAKRELTVIDGAHWLGVLVVQGFILGTFALR